MSDIDLQIPPGFMRAISDRAAGQRWVDGDKVRFVDGKARKLAGWSKYIAQQLSGKARGAHGWLNTYGVGQIGIGTNCKLYIISGGDNLIDVTPLRTSDTLTDPFDTTSGSAEITVNDTAHGCNSGDTVIFSGSTAVGGVTIDGIYTVGSVPDADSYTITHSVAATGTASGGGSTAYEYELNCGNADSFVATGWGTGGWGRGTWNTPRSTSQGIQTSPRHWSIDNYGEDMLAAPTGGYMYRWDADNPADRVTRVANCPTMRFMFVTGERYPFALGADGDDMAVAWPDQDDITDWTPTTNNSANARRLQTGSRLIAGARVGAGVSLVWSDTAVYRFLYTGSSNVYDSRESGKECGLIGPDAFTEANSLAYWMGRKDFYYFNGLAQPIPNSQGIREYVFKDINTTQAVKSTCGYNSLFNEIWWVYPSAASNEPDRYVICSLDDFSWTTGTLSRTTITRVPTAAANPIMVDENGYVYQHDDDTYNDDGATMDAFIKTGLMRLQQSNVNTDIFGFIPDVQNQAGDMTITASARDRPRGADLDTETKTISTNEEIADLRLSGREFAFLLRSNVVDGYFELGLPQIAIQAGGGR